MAQTSFHLKITAFFEPQNFDWQTAGWAPLLYSKLKQVELVIDLALNQCYSTRCTVYPSAYQIIQLGITTAKWCTVSSRSFINIFRIFPFLSQQMKKCVWEFEEIFKENTMSTLIFGHLDFRNNLAASFLKNIRKF